MQRSSLPKNSQRCPGYSNAPPLSRRTSRSSAHRERRTAQSRRGARRFSTDWHQQAGATVKLAPIASDSRVVEMLRLRLTRLGPRATQYALHLLVLAEAEGVVRDFNAASCSVQSRISTKLMLTAGSIEAFQDGTWAAYHLLEIRNTDPIAVLNEACNGTPVKPPSC